MASSSLLWKSAVDVSHLVITTPADDTSLAPIEAMRAAAGLVSGDTSMDSELIALGRRISAEIVEACRIAVGEGAEPTLRKERLTETFSGCGDETLILSRRHNVSIVSVTENGSEVALDARSLKSEVGLLERWIGGHRSRWTANEIVVVYDAGFAISPASLVGVVTDLARIRLSQESADPLVKAVTVDVDGIDSIRTERWVGGFGNASSSGFPVDLMARLSRFINPVT